MARDFLDIKVRGAREVMRALEQLPADAQREARRGAVELSRELARIVRAAGRADTRQSARAARTVRTATAGTNPAVTAGPHPLLFGSEFGIKRRTGWYAKPQYRGVSPLRTFRPHRGNQSYWFFRAQDAAAPQIRQAHQEMVDAIVRSWSA
jgi:hypothetical protein